MAIRKRNMATGAKLSVGSLGGNGGGTPITVALIPRSSMTFSECGITVVGGSAGTNTATAAATGTILFFAVKPGSNTGATDAQVAKATIPVSTAVGSEFTTRDGTAVFIDNTAAGGDDYRNAGKRVFPKGTLIRAVWVGGADTGTDADVFACYADAEEFGAAPAVG